MRQARLVRRALPVYSIPNRTHIPARIVEGFPAWLKIRSSPTANSRNCWR